MTQSKDTYIAKFSLQAQCALSKSGTQDSKKGIAEIQGILSTQDKDTQGETIFIAGMDISPLNTGMAQINWWHLGRKNPAMVVGLIDWAQKIDNDTKVAFRGHLLNTESGRAALELMQAFEEEGKQMGVSVEGSTIVKKGTNVYKSIATGCALATDQINKRCTASLIKALQDFTPDDSLSEEDIYKAIGVTGDALFEQNPVMTTNLGLMSLEEATEKLCKEYPDINPDFIKRLLIKIYQEDEQE